ncbi:MAG: TolC family protein [Sediminibacterium sp.]|jgi:outer membrane protein TolC|nr:TolC family protein [Sediminibacterium sp.]
MKKIIVIVTALFVTAIQAQAQTTVHAFSLADAVSYAQKNNVQVKNALLDIDIQTQTNREIAAAALPSVNTSLSGTNFLTIPTSLLPGQIFGGAAGTFIPVQFGTKYNSTYGANFNQLLFDGQVFIALQARATSLDWKKKGAALTEENIKANIYKIYYQLAASKTQLNILDANIERLQKLANDAAAMYKNGFAEKLDVDKVSVQLNNLQTEKLKANNSVTIGFMGLKMLMGMPIKDSLVLTDVINESSLSTDVLVENDFQYDVRKDYQYLTTVKKMSQFNVKRYQLSYLPTISINGSYTKNAQRTKFDFFDNNGNWFKTSLIGLNINLPIFNGMSTVAKIKRAKLELEQVDNQLSAMKNNIDNELSQSKLNYMSSVATVNFQKKNMQLAENVYSQTKKKFEAGTGSNTEISAAQADLVSAQNNFMNALYAALIAKVDLLKASGKL